MAQRGRLCHASSARCSQNLRHHIPCRRDARRSSTRASLEAGCPTGHRPCGDRTYRPNIGCCRLHGRPRAIPPGHQEGICLSIESVCEAMADDSAADDMTQIINPLGIGTSGSYCQSRDARGVPLSLSAFIDINHLSYRNTFLQVSPVPGNLLSKAAGKDDGQVSTARVRQFRSTEYHFPA
jgi:hypothetical protein